VIGVIIGAIIGAAGIGVGWLFPESDGYQNLSWILVIIGIAIMGRAQLKSHEINK
jgi:hypothetical protein